MRGSQIRQISLILFLLTLPLGNSSLQCSRSLFRMRFYLPLPCGRTFCIHTVVHQERVKASRGTGFIGAIRRLVIVITTVFTMPVTLAFFDIHLSQYDAGQWRAKPFKRSESIFHRLDRC